MIAKDKNPKLGTQHALNLAILKQKVVDDQTLVAQILSMPWPKGEGAYLDLATKKLRIEALAAVLEHGRPLSVLDEFRHLVERDGADGTLTDSSHMANLIPLFGEAMDAKLAKMKFYSIGIIFDGLSSQGDWVSVLLRGVLVGESMEVVQLLLDMPHTSSAYNHTALNQILLHAIGKLRHQLGPSESGTDLIRFFIHDDAQVNKKSVRFLREGLYVNSMDISCLCHVLERIGEKLNCPLPTRFMSLWLTFFSNANKRISLFRELTNAKFPSYNRIKVQLLCDLYSIFLTCY